MSALSLELENGLNNQAENSENHLSQLLFNNQRNSGWNNAVVSALHLQELPHKDVQPRSDILPGVWPVKSLSLRVVPVQHLRVRRNITDNDLPPHSNDKALLVSPLPSHIMVFKLVPWYLGV